MRFFILLEGDILARMTDEAYMQRALELALQAEGNTSPNPMVGCVIVDAEGNIVGEGYHHKAGEPLINGRCFVIQVKKRSFRRCASFSHTPVTTSIPCRRRYSKP